MPQGRDAVERVRRALDAAGAQDVEIRVVEGSIFTVEDAAATIGVPPEEILKSLVCLVDGEPVLVLMSGSNRIDSRAVARAFGGRRCRMMPADGSYGFRVGDVPPLGYPQPLRAVLDEDLFRYEVVWAAAGTDHAFFPVEPDRLMRLTGGASASVKKDAAER